MRLLFIIIAFFALWSCTSKESNPGEGKMNTVEEVYPDAQATSFFRRTSGWTAGDGAFSIPLEDGNVLWTFGDSYIDHYDPSTKTLPCLFQVRNCVLLQKNRSWNQEDATTLQGTGAGIKSYFKNNPDDTYWFWPAGGFQVGDTIYVYLSSLMKNPEGGSGLGGVQSAGKPVMAKINSQNLQDITYQSLDVPDSINFGSGFIKDEASGFVYMYGGKLNIADSNHTASDVFVARASLEHPLTNWEFWNGSQWSEDSGEIQKIAEGASMTNAVHISKINHKYILLSTAFSLGCDQGNEIFSATSESPVGPFSSSKSIYTIADTVDGHYPFFYGAVAHPEFINSDDELLITYSINGYGDCLSTCVDGRVNPDYIRPKAIRFPLDKLLKY